MHFQNPCRGADLGLTQRRIEIIAAPADASDRPLPRALYRRLIRRMPTVSPDTVYQALATLASHPLAQKTETAQSRGRSEITREKVYVDPLGIPGINRKII
jgi:Fe2+ or Zn2+ uptake regulation protein